MGRSDSKKKKKKKKNGKIWLKIWEGLTPQKGKEWLKKMGRSDPIKKMGKTDSKNEKG